MRRSGLAFGGVLELALCARWWNLPWPAFEALDPDTQAFHLAVYRCSLQMEALLNEPDYHAKR